MTNLLEIYKCGVCGNIVEVVHASRGILICCGKNILVQKENTVDASKEKHIPVIKQVYSEIIVNVGSVPHPMDKDHYIEWIELIINGKTYRQFLNPGDSPVARFQIQSQPGEKIIARAYCNLHGLWKSS